MLDETKLYWVKFTIYVIIGFLSPWATLFTTSSVEQILSMGWVGWVGATITSLIATLTAARAYLDTTSGTIKADKEWEEWVDDIENAKKSVAVK